MCEFLEQYLPKEIIKQNICLSEHTTIGIGGYATFMLFPRDKKELIKCVVVCRNFNLKFRVIGNGSNLLISSTITNIVVISTKKMKNNFILHQNRLSVSAGANINDIVMWCKDKGLSGFEKLVGIPATIGGMVVMNAGAFGEEIFDYLIGVEILDGEKVKYLRKGDIEYSKHQTSLLKSNLIILSVDFELKRLAPSVIYGTIKEVIEKRAISQPKGKSAGCIFRNTENISAGELIDKAGFKGFKLGDLVVSEKHANFIINNGFATDKDVINLIRIIEDKVYTMFKIKLEREVEYIGDEDEYHW